MCRPSEKTGATTVMSGRCEPLVNGSLTMTTSPSSRPPAAATVFSTERSIEPRCTGTCSACATSCALASNTAQEASMRSLMFGENEVRFRTAPISSAVASSALRKTSSVTGSIVLRRARPPAGASFILGSRCQGAAAGDRAAGDAAIDDELGAGDIARCVRGEKQDAVGDVLRLANAAERRAGAADFLNIDRRVMPGGGKVGPDLAPDRGVDDAGMHRVDPDVVAARGAFHRDRLAEQPDAAFCRAVARQGCRAAQPGDRRGHDDRAAARTCIRRAAHERQAVFDREEHTVEVDRGLPPPIGEAHLGDRRHHDADAGIGDQDVEASVAALDLGDHLLPLCFVGHVMAEIDRLPACGVEGRGEVVAAPIVDIADDDRGALARQGFYASLADTRGAAGHQRYLSVHLTHTHLLSSALTPQAGRGRDAICPAMILRRLYAAPQ